MILILFRASAAFSWPISFSCLSFSDTSSSVAGLFLLKGQAKKILHFMHNCKSCYDIFFAHQAYGERVTQLKKLPHLVKNIYILLYASK